MRIWVEAIATGKKKLLVAPGIATRSKKLLGALLALLLGPTRNKKLLVARSD